MTPRIYKPEIFQGNLKRKNYFEGWYFKLVSEDLDHVYSFIPGVSLTRDDPHAFIQVINGDTGESDYICYPVDEFKWNTNSLYLKTGSSVFTDKYIDLDINSRQFNIKGHIGFSNRIKYPKKILSPGIMGWYSFVPFMECKHGIVSVYHDLAGSLSVNNNTVNFTGGNGYIEKDWGTSFPEAWLWIQANNFKLSKSSFTFSVAKIPWLGKYFIGFIAFLFYMDKFYLFSTYNNSSIADLKHSDRSIDLELVSRNHKLRVLVSKSTTGELRVLVSKSTTGELRAPVSGNMSRRIRESIDSEVTLDLYDKHNNLIFNDISRRAGLEVIEKIFDYL